MPDLNFELEGVDAVAYAASPQLSFKLKITPDNPEAEILSVVLRSQIMIETTRRHYTPSEQEQLIDLFGEPERWSQTLRTMLWTHVAAVVPRFQGFTSVDLPVPCTFDFNIAATKYFHGLQDGDIPLTFLFSGSIFYATDEYAMQVAQISWEKEARFPLPVAVWKKMMDQYYPNTAWLCLRRDLFERLYQYKISRGIPTWEQVVESILPPDK